MKQSIYTLNVNGFAPEITKLTFPLIENYADKIGAMFWPITERKFPNWPVTYEKLQILELAQRNEDDFIIYIDADALVHPDMFSLAEHVPRGHVCHNGRDMASVRWRYDRYFRRDGRNIGSCNWLTAAWSECLDLWQPLTDLTLEEALSNISPIAFERSCPARIGSEHLIDDYVLSRNIARYGLKFTTVIDIMASIGAPGEWFWHVYTEAIEDRVTELSANEVPQGHFVRDGKVWRKGKLTLMEETLQRWGISVEENPWIEKALKVQGWMTLEELEWLQSKASRFDGGVVEIGSWKGRSAIALASKCPSHVFCVDTFRGSPDELDTTHAEARFNSILKQFAINTEGLNNISPIQGDSVSAAGAIDGDFDMTFIDGQHTTEAVLADLRAWLPKTNKMLCGHDANDERVVKALEIAKIPWKIGAGSIWYVDLAEYPEVKATVSRETFA